MDQEKLDQIAGLAGVLDDDLVCERPTPPLGPGAPWTRCGDCSRCRILIAWPELVAAARAGTRMVDTDPPFPYDEPNTSGPLSVRLVNTVREFLLPPERRRHGWGREENDALQAVRRDLRAALQESEVPRG